MDDLKWSRLSPERASWCGRLNHTLDARNKEIKIPGPFLAPRDLVYFLSVSALRGLRLRLSVTALATFSLFRLNLTGSATLVPSTQRYGACVFLIVKLQQKKKEYQAFG